MNTQAGFTTLKMKTQMDRETKFIQELDVIIKSNEIDNDLNTSSEFISCLIINFIRQLRWFLIQRDGKQNIEKEK